VSDEDFREGADVGVALVARAAPDFSQAVGRNIERFDQGARRQSQRHQIFLPQRHVPNKKGRGLRHALFAILM